MGDIRTARICFAVISPYLKSGHGMSELSFMPEKWRVKPDKHEMTDTDMEATVTHFVHPIISAVGGK